MVRETRHLWVANLPDNTREDRIKEHFQRYGRVQSVKIFISPGTPKTTTVPTSQFSPSGGTITSTSEINLTGKQHNNNSLADQHNLSSTITSNKCNSQQNHQLPTAAASTAALSTTNTNIGSTNILLEPIGVNSCSVSNNNVTSSNQNCITMCAATIAFVDIKSASKAHLAEHKFEDRILTTEYYEPSSMLHGSNNESGNNLMMNNSKMNIEGSTPIIGGEKDTSRHERFSTNTTTNHGHGSTDDHSPGRTNFYDRVSTSQSGNRNSETSTDFIRRNNYHSNEIRGRQRDRHFRNNPYSLIVDRSNPISHHRLTTNTWYETSPSSSNSRNHFNSNSTNSNNNAYQTTQQNQQQQPDSSYDRQNSIDTTSPSAVTTSNSNNLLKDTKGFLSTQTQALINSEQPASYKSKSLLNHHHPHNQHHHLKVIKSRSGSESPISGRSSRSHSRSPSSCSSTHSHTPPTSSHSSSSPTSGVVGDIVTHSSTPSSNSNHHRHHQNHRNNTVGKAASISSQPVSSQKHRRNLQTTLSSITPVSQEIVVKQPASTAANTISSTLSSSSSGGSVSGSNPVVHSEDNRPLAVCVKNLPLRSSDTSLKDGLFHEYKKHGKVTWVKVVGQNHERYALVCFKKPEDVEKALEVSQDKLFFGSKIEVEPYQGYDVDDNEFRPYEAEIDEYQSKSTRTLFIGNLEKNITVADLRKAFEQFGEILEIDIKKQGSSPYAFCQYADIVSVVKAVRKMDGEHFGTTRIKLGFGKSMPTSCVWLDGIVDGVSEHYLSQHFSRFGNVQKVAIDRDRKMALISFDQVQSAQSAVKETRGTSIRGRKLQVDYASRECVEAFYSRLEKFGVQSNINVDSLVTSGNNMLRHGFTSTSRSRASSFSRPGNPVSGTASPTSTPSAGSTPRHHSSAGSLNKKHRYTPEYFDTNEYIDYEMERNIVVEPDNINDGETIISSSGRRRCDKSPGDIRQVQRVDSESGNSGISSSNRRRCDRSPGEMRILESQRHKLLDELEQCPSSGDEKESPKKRARFNFDMEEDRQSHHNYHESSATNCNGKVLDHRDSSSLVYPSHNHHRFHHEMIHRKTVEIRRLSDCNIKHSASVPGGAMTSSINHSKSGRRPSTDSLSRFNQMDSYLQKRRKTSATTSTSSTSSSLNFNETDNHSSRGRGHQLHSNHSFEASGGESEHGSRPGTPLCDERPDDPMDPRTPPTTINRRLEPMILPLPKFAQEFHQKLRLSNQLLPASAADKQIEPMSSNFSHQQSSLISNRSLSPSTQTPQSRSRSNSLMPPASRRSSTSETVTSPLQPSLSNSSDSEQELGSLSGPGSSPSLEERLKKFTEDYDSWSSNGRSSSSSHYVQNYRHSVPEISVPETPVLLKMVAKNSMFDEDSKRLENVNDKYTAPVSSTVTSKNAFGSFSGNPLSLSPMLSSENSATSVISNVKIQQPVTITTMIHQRLGSSGTGSPLNSPNTASPYNSPNPSSASSISSVKGLQYPFPTHPTALTTTSTTTSNTVTTTLTTSTATATVTNCQKPKTTSTPVLGKSLSLPETQTSTSTPSANNNNLSNLNVSCNKSSTNNHKDNMHSVNVVSAMDTGSKLLMKSVSVPNNSTTSSSSSSSTSEISNEVVKSEEKKPIVAEQNEEMIPVENVVVKKEIVSENEKKNHSKERRKNSENEEKKKSREPEIESKKSEEKKSSKNHKKRDEYHHSSSSDDKKEEIERAPSPIHEQQQQRKRCVSFEDVSSVDSANEHTSKDSKHIDNLKRHHNHNNHKKSSKDKSHDDEGHSKTKDSIFDELKRNTKDNIIKSEKVHKSKKHHHHSHRENNSKDKENQTHNDTSAAEEFGRSSDDESKVHRDDQHKHRQESSEESSGKKKTPRRSLNNSLSTDDSDDSQGNKKASFFDIPDDSPNISMYDKVKARSCKNLKKQEEEKKIKDKFTALKQSRAKREQNRLKTSDDDSDSDVNDNGSHEMYKFKSQMSASEEDDKVSKKNHLSVCDEESSDGGITDHRKRNKIASRKMSRTNVIDSSDDEMPSESKTTEDKPDMRPEDFNEFDELKRNEDESSKSHKNSKKRHHEKSKEDKPSKKSKKLSKEIHRKSSEKRDEKMEEIFGPISDDDMKSESTTVANVEIKKEIDEKEQLKEESRKRKEKRRREREKQRAMKEDENSVDFDEAGRALEAQLMMSDNEQKNNNEHAKDSSKPDDVFRFTDGDDEMRRDHHDNSLKKKKKKKRAKEDRKHHHNHHHYDTVNIKEEPIDNAIESSFNNNNNTKIRMDVIKDEVKPSVPSLIDDIPSSVAVTVNQVQCKKEVKVPGFGNVVDAKIHEKAVLSIAQEMEKKPSKEAEIAEKFVEASTSDANAKLESEKIEEKSRVNISQEETEDAVAALLGESFSMSVEDEYLDPYDVPIVAETEPEPQANVNVAPEEDEEMKNAIMSLNSEIDPKPDTPQSEHDLQIDTDNDEPQDGVDEEEASSQTFDNPPKTPDVDMAQMEKDKKDRTPEKSIKKLDLSNKSDDSKIDLPSIPLTPKIEGQKDSVTPLKSEPEKKDASSSYQSRLQVPPSITIPNENEHRLLSPSKNKQPSPNVKSVQSPTSSKVLLSPRTAETKQTSFSQPLQGARSHSDQPQQLPTVVKNASVDKKKGESKPASNKVLQSPQTVPMPPQIVFQPKTEESTAKDVPEQQWQINTNSVIQKAEPAKEEVKKPSETEASHDEDEFDDNSDKKNRTNAKQRGRKTTTTDATSEDNVKNRAGKTASASKRGRGGRSNAKNSALAGNRQQKTSESDVYEFHDDSGEDSVVKSADGQRPRLIVTIKSTTSSPTTSSVPVTTSPQMQTVVQPTSTANPVLSVQELPQEVPIIQEQVPSPALSDDFAQPNSNTRKSKRLLEKDGTRTSVDDTIDDVIRNVAPPAQSSVQAQQVNNVANRRTTRQNPPVVSVPSPQPQAVHLPQQTQAPSNVVITPTIIETKKPVRAPVKKIGKDRKISENNSENEVVERKVEVSQIKVESQPNPIPTVSQPTQQPQQQSQVIVSQIPLKPEAPATAQVKKESLELLIDPVTGELQKVTQSKEGQYVPVAENRGAPLHQIPPTSMSVKQFPQFTIELKNEEKKPIVTPAPSIPATIVKVQPTIVEQPPKITEPVHVVKPVITQNPTYSKPQPHPLKTYVLSSQNITKNPIVSAPTSAPPQPPIVTSQGLMKVNPQIVNHPSTIYNLPNIIPPGGKIVTQQQLPTPTHQKTIVLPQHQSQGPSTIVHQGSIPPQIVHQKLPPNATPSTQIVIHPQQQAGNLMINIPPSSSSSQQQQGMPSPRLQVKQVIQRPMPTSQQQASPTTVVMKTGQPIHHEPKIVQTNKIIPEQGYTMSGGREIIYVGGNIQKQIVFPNYHAAARTLPAQSTQKPQQMQPVPHSPKIVGQQQAVSVTQIQMNVPQQQQQQHPQQPPPSQSQKVYFTNSGQVITSAPSTQSQEPNERPHQQWIPPHEKVTTQAQPLKSRYVMMENFEDARLQAERSQHQPALKRSYVIESPTSHQPTSQPIMPPQNKTVIGLNQQPQIMTGAVASPPLKAHLSSQQPIVTGASSSRISIPTMSPKDQRHPARHYPQEAYEDAVMHGDRSAYRSQSPPPAHQTSPLPLTTLPPYMMTKIYSHPSSSSIYVGRGEYARLSSRHDDDEQQRPGSPPLELRRTVMQPLQSPSDRITDSPMVAPLYLSPRIPQPYFYEGERERSLPSDPPPAHRAPVYSSQPSALPPPTNLSQIQREREREHREKDEIVAGHKEDGNLRYQIVYSGQQGAPPQNLIAPATNNRPIQLTTPPIASQVPLHADTLSRLLERYPLMWQGLLALKTEQAAVQMHFVFGNKKIAKASLPFNSDHTTPPLRIAQRMRLEPSQIEGVARKMQITDEHCVLLALPCGFDYQDVLRQTENLQVSFINYLQQKQAAGIINIADPGSQNPNYVVHIFPSCDFANESLERIAPDLMYKVANISHLLIVIATV